jgi:8-amino-7-oxononanoate synthase
MGIYEKCKRFTKAKEVIKSGLYPYFRKIESDISNSVNINNKKTLMFGSNSYLSLTNHPKVKQAAIDAIKKYGTGCAGSRFLNGTLDIHVELEEKLAEFVGKESALVFPTGFQTNLGVLNTLLGPKDYCVMDKLNHASLVSGAVSSHCNIIRYTHNNINDAERVIKKNLDKMNHTANMLITSDAVFSMDGDYANVKALVDLKNKYDSVLMMDEAHSLGVFGKRGEGLVSHFECTEQVDLIMGTFSKSLASIGGFIAGDDTIIHYLKHNSRPFIFSASMPPASVASVLAALEVMKNEPERIKKLWDNTKYMHKGLKQIGVKTSNGETPILPVIVGEDITAFKLCKMLQEQGIFVNPAVSPAVTKGNALIRLSLISSHTKKEIDFVLDKLEKSIKKLGII